MQVNDPVYGPFVVEDPTVKAIIASPAFGRLWRVKQHGPFSVSEPRWSTSRAEHSLGVYRLLQLLDASREEQIAGLLHDTNHLAFSHLIDWLIGDSGKQEAHDRVFTKNPHREELRLILVACDLDANRILEPKNFSLLEQPAPAMCADRVDYTLRDGLAGEQITPAGIEAFLSQLRNIDGRFVCTNINAANRFARLSIDMHMIREGSWGNALYYSYCQVIKRALQSGVMTMNDILVDDDHVQTKLHELKESIVQTFFAWERAGAPIETGSPDDYHLQSKSKLRFINPLVAHEGKVVPLSMINPGFAEYLKHYQLLRGNILFMKYPREFSGLAKL